MAAKRRPMALAVSPAEESKAQLASFKVTDSGVFQKGNLRISRGGLHQAAPKGEDIAFGLAELQISGLLGRGTSGNVRFAVHPSSGLKIALKDIDVYDEKRRQQLIPELSVLISTNHPNLVQLYDAFFDQGKIYMALEFMDSGSLDTILKQFHKVPEPVLSSCMLQTLMGLAYLHEDRQQVHRDMKPDNLLVNSEGHVKIGDFGISKQMSADQRAGTFVGTAIYMSPERLNGESYSYSSDVWAVGIIALECGVGEHPYDAGVTSYFELLPKIIQGPDPLPPKEGYSSEFRDFVRMCVQKDPADRPKADQMLQHPFILRHATDHPQQIVKEWLASGGAPLAKPIPAAAVDTKVVVTDQLHSLRASFKPAADTLRPTRAALETVSEPISERPIEASRSLDEVRSFLQNRGVKHSRLVFGVDFTKSNKFSGENTFGDRPLHWLDSEQMQLNPYQSVMAVIGRVMEPLHEGAAIPTFGFGDEETKDTGCFSFFRDSMPSTSVHGVLERYKQIVPQLSMSGGTNFAPVIHEAINLVRASRKFHLLIIICDGIVTSRKETEAAIAEAAQLPLSIVVVGVGDGPWENMAAMEEKLPPRPFNNFHFVQHHAVTSGGSKPDVAFAAEALRKVPEQWAQLRELGQL